MRCLCVKGLLCIWIGCCGCTEKEEPSPLVEPNSFELKDTLVFLEDHGKAVAYDEHLMFVYAHETDSALSFRSELLNVHENTPEDIDGGYLFEFDQNYDEVNKFRLSVVL